MSWRPHTDLPDAGEVAIIAAPCPIETGWFLLPQLYRYEASEGKWYGVSNVLQLKREVFHWLPAHDVLQTLPRQP
jgi:hypothetical protein